MEMQIVGRITQNAEVKTTNSGKEVVNFSVAVNEQFRVKATGELKSNTIYVECSMWRSASLAQYLTTGKLLLVTGDIGVRAYTGTDTRVAQGGNPIVGAVGDEERLYKIVDVLDAIANETGKSIPQVSLNWLLQRPTVCNLIIGARNEEQLKQNLGAVGWNLSVEQVKRLDEASAVRPAYPYWHQRQFTALHTDPDLYGERRYINH